jgi:hypothetical protein
LFEDLDVADRAFGHHVLFGVEVHVFLGAETRLLRVLVRGLRFVPYLAVAASAAAVLRQTGSVHAPIPIKYNQWAAENSTALMQDQWAGAGA